MVEFYVNYDRDGEHFLALVIAQQCPASLQFSSREDLHAAMEALGHEWELLSEIQDPHEYASEASAAWLKQLNEVKALKLERKPAGYSGLPADSGY